MQSLEAILNTITRHWNEKDGTLLVMGKYHPPAFWVIISCLIEKFEYELTEVSFEHFETRGYSSAIGFDMVTQKKDFYQPQRVNEGINYSRLELLDGRHAVDSVTSSIQSCVKNFFNDTKYQLFVSELNKVIGEVHDNVDAHSGKPSFSLVQKYATVKKDDYILDFCIADTGLGFKKNMEIASIPVENDIDAIKWCIIEGNSTKKWDGWKQRVQDFFSAK